MPHPLPFLVSSSDLVGRPSLTCFSPFDRTSPLLHFPPPRGGATSVFSAHGWLLVLAQSQQLEPSAYASHIRPSLVNPVTGAHIPLPPLSLSSYNLRGALSGPPSSPQCFILLTDLYNIFLLSCAAANVDGGWRKFPTPEYDIHRRLPDSIFSAVCCGGRFYCLSVTHHVYVIDPLLDVEALDMNLDQVDEMVYNQHPVGCMMEARLVESDGEVLFLESASDDNDIASFLAFRIDLSRNVWTKVDDIGDRAIFVASKGSFSMVAADVGCRKNCIYFTRRSSELNIHTCLHEPWKAFGIIDLKSNRRIDDQIMLDSETNEDIYHHGNCDLHWLIPRLDCIDHEETS